MPRNRRPMSGCVNCGRADSIDCIDRHGRPYKGCPVCRFADAAKGSVTCARCEGRGSISVDNEIGDPSWEDCPVCSTPPQPGPPEITTIVNGALVRYVRADLAEPRTPHPQPNPEKHGT